MPSCSVAAVEVCSYKSLVRSARKANTEVFCAFMSCVSSSM